jgi:hypothetical protein
VLSGKTYAVERQYRTRMEDAKRSSRSRTCIGYEEEHRGYTMEAADEIADDMPSDETEPDVNYTDYDGEAYTVKGKRTVVTAYVRRMNEAGGYMVVESTYEEGAWTKWGGWQ